MKLDLGIMAESVEGVLAGSRYARQQPSGSLYFANRFPHVPRSIPHEQDQCPCAAWATADAAWVAMTPEQRAAWNDAVAVPGISGYDLYMSWAVQCFNLGEHAPATPPPSGGFSFNPDFCLGGAAPPPECVKEEPPPTGDPCDACSALTPAYALITATGFGGDGTPFNGSWNCPQDDDWPCRFETVHPPATCDLNIEWDDPTLIRVELWLFNGPGWVAAYYSCELVYDCMEEYSLTFDDHDNCPEHPDAITYCPGPAP